MEPSYGTPGTCSLTADAVVPADGTSDGWTVSAAGAPMNFAAPVSIWSWSAPRRVRRRHEGAEIASLKVCLAALEVVAGWPLCRAGEAVQPASEQRPEGVFEAADYQRYAEAKAGIRGALLMM